MAGKLTKAQWRALDAMSRHVRIRADSAEHCETICDLDRMGLATAYTDSGNSSGIVWGSITPSGRAALAEHGEGK